MQQKPLDQRQQEYVAAAVIDLLTPGFFWISAQEPRKISELSRKWIEKVEQRGIQYHKEKFMQRKINEAHLRG